MKGAVELITIIIVACIVVSIGLMLWFYLSFYYWQVSQSGQNSTAKSLVTLSSCMRIEEASQNKFFIRNCGTGLITNDTLNVYIDGNRSSFSLDPASIDAGKTGTISLLEVSGLSIGQHSLRMANPNFETSALFEVDEVELPVYSVLDLEFDEGSGAIAYDSSLYHNDGNLQNIYPLDVIASNPSLEDPWHLVDQTDSNHITNAPETWGTDTNINFDNSNVQLGQKETSIVKDGSSALNMTLKCAGAYSGSSCLYSNITNLIPIDESQYLEGGDFQYPIKGPSIYGDISFYFYNATGGFMCRRWAFSTNLQSNVGSGWFIKSYVWQPSSASDTTPCSGGVTDTPYIPQGAKYVDVQQYFQYLGSNIDLQAMFDKFFVYQWPSMPTNDQRISRASSGWVNGMYGKALRFDGYNDYINVSSSDSLNITGNITLAAWVHPNNLTGWSNLIEKDQNGGYKLGLNNNHPVFTLYGLWNASANGVVPLNGWTHIAATYDGQNVKIYINGTLDTTIPHTDQIGTGSSPLEIGGRRTTGSNYFNGIIDDVKVWNIALTVDEINKEYLGVVQQYSGGTSLNFRLI